MSIQTDIQKLSPGAIVELYILDLTPIGGTDVFRFHPGVNALGGDVVFGGETFVRFPIVASGFGKNGQGTIPRPKVQVANVTGLLGALAAETGDLVGARLTRWRTFAKYLDAVNFPGGVNPQADPNQKIDVEIWSVDRKSAENKVFVEFELAAAHDVAGVKLPGRQVVQNVCGWLSKGGYRGPHCGYTGGPVADRNDQPVSDLALDRCGGRLGSCKLRFGADNELPFGAFPAAGLIR